MSSNEGERIASLEARAKDHDRRLDSIDGRLQDLSGEVSDAKADLKGVAAQVRSIGDEIKASSRRNMWAIGIIVTLVNISIDAALIVFIH